MWHNKGAQILAAAWCLPAALFHYQVLNGEWKAAAAPRPASQMSHHLHWKSNSALNFKNKAGTRQKPVEMAPGLFMHGFLIIKENPSVTCRDPLILA